MFCPNCGSSNQDTSGFCSACGNSLKPEPMPNKADTLSSEDKALIFFGNVLISPILGLILYFVWKDTRPRRASEVCRVTWWGIGLWVVLIVVIALIAAGTE